MKYFIVVILLLFMSCSQQSVNEGDLKIMDQSVIDNLKSLEKFKIYFGHQSVGYNIVDGIADLVKKAGNKNINIIESDGTGELPEYFFAHSAVGKNTEPNSKCDAFSGVLNEEFTQKLDVALLKFCYIDIRADDDPKAIFEYYKNTIDSIKVKYPELQLVHITAPIRTVQKGLVASIKEKLGKELGGYADNVKRFEYNVLLKDYYKNDPIYDLAKVESTYPDGSRESFKVDGNIYYAMIPAYTSDSGHLNELGRQLAAKELIKVLASLTEK